MTLCFNRFKGVFDSPYSVSQTRIAGINSLEILTCFVFHCIAIYTKLLGINYSDLYINFDWFQNYGIEEVLVAKLLRIFIPEYDQSSGLVEVSCQNVMPRQLKSLSYSFASLLNLLFAVLVVTVVVVVVL